MSEFEPDYRNVEAAARNQRPRRLPIYEHLINVESIEKLLDRRFGDLLAGDAADVQEYFDIFCGFWREMTYDTVSFEVHTLEVLPGGGALLGEQDGPIQNHSDFERYPWDDLPRRFMEIAVPRFEALRRSLPPGMKIVGGVGNGLFEVSEDLVGFEKLCYMLADDPKLFAALYKQIGDLLAMLWKGVLERFADLFAICRIGDDMGFKTATLMAPPTLIEHVVPQYARLAEQIHEAGRPFLLHSCGRIFDLMEPLIAAGIDAKHSNEDAIAPFDEWIDRYGDRIGLFGGIDADRLCRTSPDDIYEFVLEQGTRYRQKAHGLALGSGNSIPAYVPADSYRAMIRASQEIRRREATA